MQLHVMSERRFCMICTNCQDRTEVVHQSRFAFVVPIEMQPTHKHTHTHSSSSSSSSISISLTCAESDISLSVVLSWRALSRRRRHNTACDEFVNNGGIGECACVAQLIELIVRNFSQNASHDLATASLGKCGGVLDEVGGRKRPDLVPDLRLQFLDELIGHCGTVRKSDKCVYSLSLHIVWIADDRRLNNRVVAVECLLKLRRANAVSRHIQDVIATSRDEVVSLLITIAAVASKVVSGILAEVCFLEARVVAEHGSHLSRPGALDDQGPLARTTQLDALFIDNGGHNAKEGKRCGTRLCGYCGGEGCEHVAASLGLPPRVHHRALSLSNDVEIPLPRSRVNRLTHTPKHRERVEIALVDKRVAKLHE
eukprot:Opistho-2@5821